MLSFGPISGSPLAGFVGLFVPFAEPVESVVIVNVPIADSYGLASMLEAVNIVLRSGGEAPVQSLDITGLSYLDSALADLMEASRLVQSVGFKFNREDCYPLTRDSNGLITLPANTLKCDVDDRWNWTTNAVQRGVRLYDAKAHSYQFKQDLTAEMTFLLGWDELPEPARAYITIKAARKFQARDFGSQTSDGFSANDEQAAMLALSDYDSDTGDYNMLSDSLSVAQVLFDKQDFAPRY